MSDDLAHEAALADECRALLHRIESGETTLSLVDPNALDWYCGNVRFTASDGWRLAVFNDCDQWDYVDHFESPDGRLLDINVMLDRYPDLGWYQPSDEEQDRLWCWGGERDFSWFGKAVLQPNLVTRAPADFLADESGEPG